MLREQDSEGQPPTFKDSRFAGEREIRGSLVPWGRNVYRTPVQRDSSSLQRSETETRLAHPLSETLRSAGARVVLTTGLYKHSAPLEPEPYLVAV
jgi:hypothetical protein